MQQAEQSAEVVICGAGIAGISAAYFLAVRHGVQDIVICDPRPALSLTSDKSTECYRNWWPGPDGAMVAFMNHSIDLLEQLARESQNVFHLNRRGYLYVTGNKASIPHMLETAQAISELGAGPLRIHQGSLEDPPYQPTDSTHFDEQPAGADLFLDARLIEGFFPALSSQAVAALHVRRAGWFSAQQLGIYLLEQARASGVKLISAQVSSVVIEGGKVTAVLLDNGVRLNTQHYVLAAGPLIQQSAAMLGETLPVFNELHLKAAFADTLGIVPRQAPLLIWNDPQRLDWSDAEKGMLQEDSEMKWLLGKLPAGAHTRPDGGDEAPTVLMLWEYDTQIMEPTWPLPIDPVYAEIALRGLMTMLPGLRAYLERMPRPYIDGGYYTKTRENRPLIGPLKTAGAYIIGALSGFGLMAACAAGDLLAAYVTGSSLPTWAKSFHPARYADPAYMTLLEQLDDSGQL